MINELRSSERENNDGQSHATLRAAWKLNDQGRLEISWRTEEMADRSSRANDAGLDRWLLQAPQLLRWETGEANRLRNRPDDYHAAADKLQ
jgi:hypothetical protein